MPGNLIVINRSKELTWYVGDSKMDELIKFLHKIGIQQQPSKPNKALKADGPDTVPVITTDLCKECDKLRILSIEDRPTA